MTQHCILPVGVVLCTLGCNVILVLDTVAVLSALFTLDRETSGIRHSTE